MHIILDEDIPRGFRDVLEKLNFTVTDVRDVGLRGASDEVIFRFVCAHDAPLMTEDLDFTNPARFQLQSIKGILINRLPQTISLQKRIDEIKKLLRIVDKESFIGYIAIFEAGRMRRRPLSIDEIQ